MRNILKFLIVMISATFAQTLDDEQMNQLLLQSGDINLEALSNQQLSMNPFIRQLMVDSLIAQQNTLQGERLDSNLFILPDTLLAGPATLDSNQSPESQKEKRYINKIFDKSDKELFGSVTNNVSGDYPLKAGDALQVVIWGDVEKVYDAQVNNQGKVLVEGAGLISINGLTLKESEVLIKKRMSRIHASLRSGRSQLSLSIQSLSPIKIFLMGEVNTPGGYVFHGNTSVLLALFYAEGVNQFGSVRDIIISRNGDSINVDLYDFLFNAIRSEGSILKDGDIVYVPRAKKLIEVQGDVGRPSTYELKDGEGYKEILKYAGGINPSVSDNPMTLRRYFEDGQMDILNLSTARDAIKGQSNFEFKDGDVLYVPASTEEMKNIITVLGAVKYPNTYELTKNTSVLNAIKNAGGPRDDAYLDRIQIIRSKISGGRELFTYSLAEEGATGVELKGKDTLLVFSQKEFYRPDSIEVTGAVKNPGIYPYYENMTARDLVLMSGGALEYSENGVMRLERLKEDKSDLEIFNLNTDKTYSQKDAKLTLKAKDRLIIPVDPMYKTQEVVNLRGSFLRPGNYSLQRTNETLKSLIERVGYVRENAYLGGARFYRYPGDTDLLEESNSEVREQLAIDFVKALQGDEQNNISLKAGDSIFVPEQKVWVKVRGEVGSPTNVLFKEGVDIYYYISRAGGFTPRSDEERIIITYANGGKMATDNGYDSPDPGAEIYVPKSAIELPTNWLEITRTIASIFSAAILPLIVIQLTNK